MSDIDAQILNANASSLSNVCSYFTKVSKQDLATAYFYIPDTSMVFRPKDSYTTATVIDKYGSNRVAPEGLLTIYPYRQGSTLLSTCYIDSNLMCIPFYGGIDEESTLFTFWHVEGDSMAFHHLYQNIFFTKYARAFIDTSLYFDSIKVLIGNTLGGEGGASFKELWIAKELSKDRIGICHSYLKGWESDGEIRYTLNSTVTNDRINVQVDELYLQLNSANSWDTIRSITVLNDTVDLNSVINEECR